MKFGKFAVTLMIGATSICLTTGCSNNDFSGRQVSDAVWNLNSDLGFPVSRSSVSCPSANAGDEVLCRVGESQMCIAVFAGSSGPSVRNVGTALGCR